MDVGVGVSEGVAGTGVKVARRVTVGLGVSVDVGVTPATAVGVGGCMIRPQPLRTKLHTTTSQARPLLGETLRHSRWPDDRFAVAAASQSPAFPNRHSPRRTNWPWSGRRVWIQGRIPASAPHSESRRNASVWHGSDCSKGELESQATERSIGFGD